ncbi:MAG: hypothetical protein A2X78_02005 [Gammaproteobacteria bacterium GWE2_37_16]|nr:MAG: hypothetical protein A2X78_02005 [Gammaproteobacteria bacterium GWE2_37_16]
MPLIIYDIDGTLTHVHGDIQDTSGCDTYAFWPLISYHFSDNEVELRKMVADWEKSMITENDPVGSSYKIMQAGIQTFRANTNSSSIREYAKQITELFVKHKIIHQKAISHLENSIRNGAVCLFSTGSYQDGAYGFRDGLVASGTITQEIANQILISGAKVDWENKTLLHANVRERKIIGLEQALEKPALEIRNCIKAVFADDPLVNDRDILNLAPPNKAFVITTGRNSTQTIPDRYIRTTWDEIMKIDNDFHDDNRVFPHAR